MTLRNLMTIDFIYFIMCEDPDMDKEFIEIVFG
jgi:hypothetical protein